MIFISESIFFWLQEAFWRQLEALLTDYLNTYSKFFWI